ncbi:MAG TPA: PRC-barrel domain-containing protein [Gemmatimonadaceae bacterium]|nr:PRC-barrel domain-containing protein [Gemmatimonadaceae bacterium]
MNDQMAREENDRAERARRSRLTGGNNLARLEDLDNYEIADGQPDIRGWKVKTTTDGEVGRVESLIADPIALKVRYLEVKVKREVLGTERDENILIPISAAQLNDDNNTVIVNALPPDGLRGVPRFGRGTLTPEQDRTLTDYYGRDTSSPDDQVLFFGIVSSQSIVDDTGNSEPAIRPDRPDVDRTGDSGPYTSDRR